MCYNWQSVLSILATMVFAVGVATPVAPRWEDVRVKHAWNSVPVDWESLGPPHASTTIDLHIALEPRNENALIDAVYEVSTPGNPKYGAHLSKEEVAKLMAPHSETLKLVHLWLSHHGLPSSSISMTRGGSWLKLTDVPVSQANRLLGASYEIYRDVGANDSTILRTVGYGLPAVLHAHIKTVLPTTCFASIDTPSIGAAAAPANVKVGPRNPAPVVSKEDEITPTHLRWLYNTFAYVPKATDQNVLAIAGWRGDYPSPADLKKFMWEFRQTTDVDYTVERVDGGGYDPRYPSSEGNLGMQYTQVMAYPTPLIYYSTGGKAMYDSIKKRANSRDHYHVWLTYLLDQTKIPQTISSAVGIPENKIPLEYATTLCTLFLELAGRGVSVLFSSGNVGVGVGDCKDKSGKVQFNPSFPASCPWVTSVGGTTSLVPEVAAKLSTGGFSIHFPRPEYQNVAVLPYIRALIDGTFGGIKYNGLYNSTGRGVPDISAQALNYLIYNNAKSAHVNGTSAAVQTAGAIIALLNDYLISKGKRPLGFLNFWLYGPGLGGLNDIISGSNPGCGTDGFSAMAGWDPVTGLGTPNFYKLQKILYETRINQPNPP